MNDRVFNEVVVEMDGLDKVYDLALERAFFLCKTEPVFPQTRRAATDSLYGKTDKIRHRCTF